MAGTAPQIEWFIARDGAQHGPISDVEMRKFVELGHLRPADLVWCAKFPDWRTGAQVFPELAAQERAAMARAIDQTAQLQQPMPNTGGSHQLSEGDPGHSAGHGSAQGMHGAPGTDHVPAQSTTRPRRQSQAHKASQPQPERPSREQNLQPAAYSAEDRREPMAITTTGSDTGEWDEPAPARRSGFKRFAAIAAGLLIFGGIGWIGWQNRNLFPGMSAVGGVVMSKLSSGPSLEHLRTAPYVAPGDTKDAIDASLQRIAIWRTLKKDFPDWYAERLVDVERMRAQKQDERLISKFLADVIVVLRRRNGQAALQASPDHLKRMASGFLANLKQLSSRDASACFSFISFGEANPFMLELTKTSAFGEHVQRQMLVIYDAIADGLQRKAVHPATRRTDYDTLTAELTARGWTQTDLATFSDPQRLSSSAPEKVCSLVQDWFTAQLALKDTELQTRLLAESLKPLVFG